MPSCECADKLIDMRISFMPALPKNRAHTLQKNAADVPKLISVSMVNAPCRRF